MSNQIAIARADLTKLPVVRVDHTEKGMFVRFQNGMTLSIQWGEGNYTNGVDTVETAAWFGDRSPWFCPKTGRTIEEASDVQGWQTVAEVMESARVIAAHSGVPDPNPINPFACSFDDED